MKDGSRNAEISEMGAKLVSNKPTVCNVYSYCNSFILALTHSFQMEKKVNINILRDFVYMYISAK